MMLVAVGSDVGDDDDVGVAVDSGMGIAVRSDISSDTGRSMPDVDADVGWYVGSDVGKDDDVCTAVSSEEKKNVGAAVGSDVGVDVDTPEGTIVAEDDVDMD